MMTTMTTMTMTTTMRMKTTSADRSARRPSALRWQRRQRDEPRQLVSRKRVRVALPSGRRRRDLTRVNEICSSNLPRPLKSRPRSGSSSAQPEGQRRRAGAALVRQHGRLGTSARQTHFHPFPPRADSRAPRKPLRPASHALHPRRDETPRPLRLQRPDQHRSGPCDADLVSRRWMPAIEVASEVTSARRYSESVTAWFRTRAWC